MGTFVGSFFRPSKMPPSPAETPENETNPQTQDQLSLNPSEAAYLRFESPEEEIRKFIRRLTRLGASQWPRDAEIVELFCGRGNGLLSLQSTIPPLHLCISKETNGAPTRQIFFDSYSRRITDH